VSQTGYLLAAFAVVVAVILAWLGIIVAKVARIRRDAAVVAPPARRSADG
jgi:hypothetical protein